MRAARILVLVMVAALVAVPVQAGARAGARRPAVTTDFAADPLVRLGAGAAHDVEAARASLVALGAQLPAAADPAGTFETTTAAGDLDGDGGPDVLSTRYVPVAEWDRDLSLQQYRPYVVTIDARRGVDGKLLWSVVGEAAWRAPLPIRTATGAGVLIVGYDFGRVGDVAAWTYPTTLNLQALSGAGAPLWSTSLTGAQSAVNFAGTTATALPYIAGLEDMVAGASTDVLVGVVDFARNNRTGTYPYRIEARVLDGTTGAVASSAAEVVPHTVMDNEPGLLAVGDLDADGLSDHVTVVPGADPTAPALVARRGRDGGDLWRTSGVAISGGSYPTAVGDVTGDGRADLAVAVPGPVVHLISGADGRSVWQRPGAAAYALGDVTGDSRPDVLTAAVVADGERVGLRLAATDGAGVAAYGHEHVLGGVAGASALYLGLSRPGDVDADGATETIVIARAAFPDGDGRPLAALDLLVAGRDGRALRDVGNVVAVGGSLDGEGADLLELATAPDGVRVRAVDGATGATRWTSVVDAAGPAGVAWTLADLDRDGGGELLVTARGAAGWGRSVLDGRTGTLRWRHASTGAG